MQLVRQYELRHGEYRGPDWHLRVAENLSDKLGQGSAFPCTFAKNSAKRELVLFGFVESLSKSDLKKASTALRKYVELCSTWDGKISTAHPLVMAFAPDIGAGGSVEDFHKIGWDTLQFWHDNDPAPWPESVSQNPNAPFWSYCFAGTQLFVNMSSPAHKVRKSRNLGDSLMLIINPRERFDIVAGDTPAGRQVRHTIRTRIEKYDGQPHAPQLGSYEAGEIEWWQYGITETNLKRTDTCPFQFQKKPD